MVKRIVSAFSVLVLLAPVAVYGQTMTLSLAQEGQTVWSSTEEGVQTGPLTYDFEGGQGGDSWAVDWDVEIDIDPFVSGAFGVTNTGAVPQNFTLMASLPILPVTPSSLVGGSTGGSVTDGNFDGMGGVSTQPGLPLYRALLDGVQFTPMDIYSDPTTFPAAATYAFPGETRVIPAVNLGLPGPTIPGPAVNSTIAIEHNFVLAPGDSVAFTSFLLVVPEPASMLFLLGGLPLLLRRRRSR